MLVLTELRLYLVRGGQMTKDQHIEQLEEDLYELTDMYQAVLRKLAEEEDVSNGLLWEIDELKEQIKSLKKKKRGINEISQ